MKQFFILILLIFSLLLLGCFPEDFIENANQKFGDQHFKTAIALIELHKIRFNEYPDTLKELKYLGDWDNFIFHSVEYKKLNNGYELNLIRGWISKPNNLEYPDEFWQGLGLVKSNIKKY